MVLPKVAVGRGSQYRINRITVETGSQYLSGVVDGQGCAGRGFVLGPGTIKVGAGSRYLSRAAEGSNYLSSPAEEAHYLSRIVGV